MVDIDPDEGEGMEAPPPGEGGPAGPAAPCLSCGAVGGGVFCAVCGQKNDDLRRSIFVLAREFAQDTFSFDSRMWRTLGVLAVAPGVVPNAYAHGRRSRFTPPVRLFLVVSFLFFLVLAGVNTRFIAIYATQLAEEDAIAAIERANQTADKPVDVAEAAQCAMSFELRFFVRAKDVPPLPANWAACRERLREEAADVAAMADTEEGETSTLEIVERALNGVQTAIENPASFNAAFNEWLPRIMILMTPVSALILGLFIRGRDALFFDHLVLAFYSHAIGFAAFGAAVLLIQAGVPFAGYAATLFLFAYFVGSLKRAYGRGWVKTVWTALAGGLLYSIILTAIVAFIVVRIILNG